jgi:hypothetical protein
LQLCHARPELVSLLQDALPALFDEGIEFGSKFCHAITKIVETEINAGKCVGEYGTRRSHSLPACGERWFEYGCHSWCFLKMLLPFIACALLLM